MPNCCPLSPPFHQGKSSDEASAPVVAEPDRFANQRIKRALYTLAVVLPMPGYLVAGTAHSMRWLRSGCATSLRGRHEESEGLVPRVGKQGTYAAATGCLAGTPCAPASHGF